MIVFPNCKINLGLNIIHKRTDGYHDLETIFYPVYITDILELTEYKEPQRSFSIPFTITGLDLEGDPAANLCVKAYKLLRKDFPQIPHIQMHLHKVIPSGAGLGGGSSDAAFTVQVLNDKFNLGLSREQLIKYGAELGSDCPFFIINQPCFAEGRGEYLDPIDLDLSSYKFVIVYPGIHVNTGRAFLNISPAIPEKTVKEVISQPIETWKNELKNDFETVAFKQHPAIVEIKDQLYMAGAIYASMSGSGSTVFGIFEKDQEIALSFPANYFVRELFG